MVQVGGVLEVVVLAVVDNPYFVGDSHVQDAALVASNGQSIHNSGVEDHPDKAEEVLEIVVLDFETVEAPLGWVPVVAALDYFVVTN